MRIAKPLLLVTTPLGLLVSDISPPVIELPRLAAAIFCGSNAHRKSILSMSIDARWTLALRSRLVRYSPLDNSSRII
jgi:hypothetical protein